MAPPPVPLSASSPTAPAPSSSRAEPVPIRGTGQSSGPLPTCLMPVLPAETVVSAIPTCALPSPSPGTTPPSPTAIKEDKNLDGGVKCVPKAATTAHEGAPMKKRKTGPGYRGVANLTPEQLAKKRANDREAQRAIRERTKAQIDSLERRIRELTSQKPYQELEAALRAKHAAENEIGDIKRRLQGVVSMLQPLIGNAPAADHGVLAQSTGTFVSTTPQSAPTSMPHAPTPLSTSSPSPATPDRGPSATSRPNSSSSWSAHAVLHARGSVQSRGEHEGRQTQNHDNRQQQSLAGTRLVQSTDAHTPPGLGTVNELAKQATNLSQHTSEAISALYLGPDRLNLDFLLEPQPRRTSYSPTSSPATPAAYASATFSRLQIPKMQAGAEGAQDSPEYRHVPMKHDWKSAGSVAALCGYGPPGIVGMVGGTPPENQLLGPGGAASPYFPPKSSGSSCSSSVKASNSVTVTSPAASACEEVASIPPKVGVPTCPLDSMLVDFLAERRQRAEEGLSTSELLGPRHPSVSGLLNPARSIYSHPLSKFFTDILATFPTVSGLPERVAVLYIMFLIMRWQISLSAKDYVRMPSWARPVNRQLTDEHPAWIDYVAFPMMRDRLVKNYNQEAYLFDNFFVPFTTTLNLNWPYDDNKVLLRSPDGKELMVNPVFDEHIRRLENWTLGTAFKNALPSLNGTFRVRDDVDRHRERLGREKERQRFTQSSIVEGHSRTGPDAVGVDPAIDGA